MDQQIKLSRRSIVAGAGASATVCLSGFRADPRGQQSASATEATVSGFVRCCGDDGAISAEGLGGVMVSNGCDVALSAGDGSWTLPMRPGECISLIKPPNWRPVSRDGANADAWFRRLPIPENEQIEFLLTRDPEPSRFDVLLIADTQAANASELDYVRRELVPAALASGARFAIHHGDVMGDDLSLLGGYREILRQTEMPWRHCPGNHDMDFASLDNEHAFDTWKRVIGPTHSAIQCGQATFIQLNNVEYCGRDTVLAGGERYRGTISDAQLSFVRSVLAHVPRDHLVVLSTHIPFVCFDEPEGPSTTTANWRSLLDALSQHPNAVSFSGHSHTTEHHHLHHGQFNARHHHHVLTAFCGSWWTGPDDPCGIPVSDSRDGTPRGFHILSVEGNRYATRYVAAGNNDAKLRLLIEPAATDSDTCALVVDVFDGGPKTTVRCEIDGEEKLEIILSRVSIADPYIKRTYDAHRRTLKPWVAAAPSSHIWSAALPASVTRGTFACTVYVTDEYGRSYHVTENVDLAA